MKSPLAFLSLVIAAALLAAGTSASTADEWVVYEGGDGPGAGKHIVLVAGDDEYRSEEALPQLGKILSEHHGFKCTVLFPIDPDTGEIKPDYQKNIPGLEALESADMMIVALRFRGLPDEQMKYIDDYVNSGKPIMGLRTATHAFNGIKSDAYKKYNFNHGGPEWVGGFGREILGDTWINHHGGHNRESTRGVVNEEHAEHPVLNSVEDVWGPTDVYGIKHLPEDATVLLWGAVLEGMKPTDKPVAGRKNDPMMPLAWVREWQGAADKPTKVFTTTMGSSTDLESEDLRRLLVNGVFWATGLEVPEKADATIVGEFKATPFGFGTYQKGTKPADYELK